MARKLTLFFAIVASFAAILYPPYLIPVVDERRWGPVWGDIPNTFGAMQISDHIDWLVLGLELGLIIGVAIGLTIWLNKD